MKIERLKKLRSFVAWQNRSTITNQYYDNWVDLIALIDAEIERQKQQEIASQLLHGRRQSDVDND